MAPQDSRARLGWGIRAGKRRGAGTSCTPPEPRLYVGQVSTESKEPEDIVRDGVQADGQDGVPQQGRGDAPVAREEGAAVTPEGTGSTEAQASAGATDAGKAAGPAEEQDEQTADDRGLTTDTNPD